MLDTLFHVYGWLPEVLKTSDSYIQGPVNATDDENDSWIQTLPRDEGRDTSPFVGNDRVEMR
jgi:hypothetical protein